MIHCKSVCFGVASVLLTGAGSVAAQPAADLPVARYQDNATPYPLFAGCFSMQPAWTESDIESLARNFDAFYGSAEVPRAVAEQIRARHPGFSFLKYQGNWTISGADVAHVENGHRDEVLYYRAANLAGAVTDADTRLKLTNQFGRLPALVASTNSVGQGTNQTGLVRWLRVGTEYLKVANVEGEVVTVDRGFAGSRAATHTNGTPVLAPVWGRAPMPGQAERFAYRHDPRSLMRWRAMLPRMFQQHAANGGGIWIDILIGNFGQFTWAGEPLGPAQLWNLEKDEPYAPADLARYTQRGVRFMQDEFKQRTGQWPVIWANNMDFPLATVHARLQLLLTNPVYPRAIDAFAQENSYGQWGQQGNSGKQHSWASMPEWITNTASIMFMGELKVAARPLAFDGGIDNLKFASLAKEERHRRLLYAYASYLIAVRVEPDDRIYTALGLCPLANNPDGADPIEVDPSFLWDIGRPVETRPHREVEKYRWPGRDVFVRRFENGLVLVNPSDRDENNLELREASSRPLRNPDAGHHPLTSLSLSARTAAILLYEP